MQEKITVKVKKLSEHAVIPVYAHAGEDAGLDLVATSCEYADKIDSYIYGVGLAFEIPQGYVGLVFPRSSHRKTNSFMPNSVGVIDSGYRGEVTVTYKNRSRLNSIKPYNIGDKVAQLIIMPYPYVKLEETKTLSESARGTGGHGSTGK